MRPASASAAFPFPSVGPRRHDPAAVAAVAQALTPLQADGLRLLVKPEERRRLSRDAYDYSPVLTPKLAAAEAELVACPVTVEQVEAVAAACAQRRVPITMRGAGTGNYGQAVPLQGGVLLAMTGLRTLRSATGDRFTAEAGCRLVVIDEALAPHGVEQRLLPSTYRTATIGGFVAGGSGGSAPWVGASFGIPATCWGWRLSPWSPSPAAIN
ncbi:FAD-binding oxidoreductase [Candidatus Synechococcus spongiarum]|uniref:FAD-binding oxidoreductase n=1 Tax=Candidatus Synechococcus spongiarum TaxID=431041 RepID=UPI001F255313|nr:FAD-binding protein [Candidatus Synechococcus spongiarum]